MAPTSRGPLLVLTGRGATIEYDFENMDVLVPRDASDDAPRARALTCETLDQALVMAYESGKITAEEAIRHADSGNDVRLMIKMHDRGNFSLGEELGLSYDNPREDGKFVRR